MKTRDLIVLTSLQMFNEEGESTLTAVDIANELDISPGNLYYHFKGKPQIVAEIFTRFSQQLTPMMWVRSDDIPPLEDSWLHGYVLLELLYNYRFFFRNVAEFQYRYPDTGSRLIKLIDQLEKSGQMAIAYLGERGVLALDPTRRELIRRLAEQINLTRLYYPNYRAHRAELTRRAFIEETSLQILMLLSPYLSSAQISAVQRLHSDYLTAAN